MTALAAASLGAGSASAASKPVRTRGQWQAALAHVAAPGSGCYHASYPALQWHATRCTVAPKWPLAPVLPSGVASRGGPVTVGDGQDYAAKVSGLISRATGTFKHVTPTITESGQVGGSGSKVRNSFSLQLNSQFFSGSPACSGSSNPASCEAWQQFVYTYQNATTGYIFMQYWLINYNATCPTGWFTYSTDCYTNSNAAVLPGGPIKAKQLASTKLVATAKAGGKDGVSVTVGTGSATLVTNADTKVHLAKFWNTTEWGVYGDGGGGEAFFGANSTLETQTALQATSSAAPTCLSTGYTAETNNLNLISTPALGSQPSPTMASMQSNASSGTPSCATAS